MKAYTQMQQLHRPSILDQDKNSPRRDALCVQFEELVKVLSLPPAYTTVRVNTHRYKVEDVRNELQHQLQQDEKFATVTVKTHPVLWDLLIIPSPSLRGPGYVVPSSSDKKIIIDTDCATAVLRGAHIFAPGVIGCTKGILAGDKVSVLVDIDGECRRGLMTDYTGQTAFIANGVMRHSRKTLMENFDKMSGIAVEISETFIRNPCLNGLLKGKIYPQNLPSVVCGHVLDPQPGEVVLDMCAAPGGKTTHIASLIQDEGVVVALDKSKSKISTIKRNTKDLGLTCIYAFAADSTKIVDETLTEIPHTYKPPYPAQSFDRILLDAPCSATGQRAQIVHRQSVLDMKSHPAYQKKLMKEAVTLLKKGGVLVYSTCAIPLEENESVVAWTLKEFPNMILEKQDPHVGGPGLKCVGLNDRQSALLQRFWPKSAFVDTTNGGEINCNNDTIGFFVAKFMKR